ncbi:MAG: Rieske 2Fe-2S domain-containing protein [Anaerolineae bacterium]|nr:Rieske 2Fe-2S domain-containing protein [Anaerolineae bacterium]MDQ7034480.1 Rieske 2Fe-2S domain-containing protein [Anaerolineae bacterium]
MATANPAKGKSITTPTQTQAAPAIQVDAPSRREFMYYIWGASMAMLLGQFTIVGLWFAYPRFREGEFGGIFPFDPAEVPSLGSPPISNPSGHFWVSQTEEGLMVMYDVCTHLGCLPKWVSTNTRFECPCHGSKYRINGTWIEGPAPRGLDLFPIEVTYEDGTVVTNETGIPIPLDPEKTIISISVNTGTRVLGPAHGIVDFL